MPHTPTLLGADGGPVAFIGVARLRAVFAAQGIVLLGDARAGARRAVMVAEMGNHPTIPPDAGISGKRSFEFGETPHFPKNFCLSVAERAQFEGSCQIFWETVGATELPLFGGKISIYIYMWCRFLNSS